MLKQFVKRQWSHINQEKDFAFILEPSFSSEKKVVQDHKLVLSRIFFCTKEGKNMTFNASVFGGLRVTKQINLKSSETLSILKKVFTIKRWLVEDANTAHFSYQIKNLLRHFYIFLQINLLFLFSNEVIVWNKVLRPKNAEPLFLHNFCFGKYRFINLMQF